MALVDGDGFDFYNGLGANVGLGTKWTNNFPAMVAGRFGGQAAQCSYNGASATTATSNWPGSYGSFTVGMAINWRTIPVVGPAPVICFKNGTGYNVGILVTSTGAIAAVRQASDLSFVTLGTSAAGLMVTTVWDYYEFEVVISATIGRVTIYKNGQQILNVTGANTQNAAATCNVLQLGITQNDNRYGQFYCDDYYLSDAAAKLGEMRVMPKRPSSDGTVVWTPNSGANNYSRVNETLPDSDTTYVQSSNVGDRDLYNLAALGLTPSTIFGARALAFVEKTDAGTRSIKVSVKSNATDNDGSEWFLSSAYNRFEGAMMTVDPDTSAAWGITGLDALKGGPRVWS